MGDGIRSAEARTVSFTNLLDPLTHRAVQLDELRAGLSQPDKTVPPLWFYDDAGSRLFDEITRLPEYHVTRCERHILNASAADVAARTEATALIELGSGTSDKTTVLLDALTATGQLRLFVPFDVSEETLHDAAEALGRSYPDLSISAIVGDFHHHLGSIPAGETRLVAFLGSTIGNLDPTQRRRFLGDVHAALRPGDWLLLGTDLIRSQASMVAAYDDAAGVTARFNKNLLVHLNREVDADFDVDAFDHVALWNEERSWIEMRLRSRRAQQVSIRGIGLDIRFAAGEDIRTEVSSKFTPDQVRRELADAGFDTEATYSDDDRRFLLTLARPVGGR